MGLIAAQAQRPTTFSPLSFYLTMQLVNPHQEKLYIKRYQFGNIPQNITVEKHRLLRQYTSITAPSFMPLIYINRLNRLFVDMREMFLIFYGQLHIADIVTASRKIYFCYPLQNSQMILLRGKRNIA